MNKLALFVFLIGAVFISDVLALSSSDINTTSIIQDLGIVFIAILSVLLIRFGWSRIVNLISDGDHVFDMNSGGGEYYQNGKKYEY